MARIRYVDHLKRFRPQRIEDTTPNDDEVNSNSIFRQPGVRIKPQPQPRPQPTNADADAGDQGIVNNQVSDSRPSDVTGIRNRPRIRISTSATTTTTSTTTTTTTAAPRSPVITSARITTPRSLVTASTSSDDVSSSTTEIIVEDFSNFTRARGTTPPPNRPPPNLRTFPAVPGLSPDDINSMVSRNSNASRPQKA